MFPYSTRFLARTIAAIGLVFLQVGCEDRLTNTFVFSEYTVTPLVADVSAGGAPRVDPKLVNPWGMAFGPTGVLWVANNGTGTSTLYDASGIPLPLVVTIPSKGAPTGGLPTGTIFSGTTGFVMPTGGVALFIFASEDGVITAWNTGTTARVVADRSTLNAVYKGIAMASNAGANFLYVTNFKGNNVDVFDRTFRYVRSFADPSIPAGFAPFGIQNLGGMLYVTYAKQLAPDNLKDEPGMGNGFVDIFNPDGTLAKRFVSSGRLNSPWGVALAPPGFGSFSGDILIGNFGDGLIGAYDPVTGNLIDFLRDLNAAPITLDGLWGFVFGPGTRSTTLYFTSGPALETHGLLGMITPR